MSTGFFNAPEPVNEPVKSYAQGSAERTELKAVIKKMRSETAAVCMRINGKETTSDNKIPIHPPHDHRHTLGWFYKGEKKHVRQAIGAALAARKKWASLPWGQRAAIFLRAADLLAGPFRYKMNAATMLGQSKNVYQAEIDSACEMIDFLRFNVKFMTGIYKQQPASSSGMWNRMEHRPLEGFVWALTPFNFTSIAGNLPTAPALMGNVVVWKASNSQTYSAKIIMDVLEAAGLPPGVINLTFASGPDTAEVVLSHPDFAGIHYTGSTETFNTIWKTIGNNIEIYKTYPRIVGETGGKDFVIAHTSALVQPLVTALVRGAFEYQGQKCSAASRAYIPSNLWPEVKGLLVKEVRSLTMGGVEDFSNFINAVISEDAFDTIKNYIDHARKGTDSEILVGGKCDKSKGYFIQPTVILAKKPQYVTMCEEIFGPVLTVYVYNANRFDDALDLVNTTSRYSLTGSVFAQDRYAIELACRKLEHAAGNFYINDKPTGAVVNQQPFGGSRKSGTNDKAGSLFNLLRWVSQRSLKETFVPPDDYRYPFMAEK